MSTHSLGNFSGHCGTRRRENELVLKRVVSALIISALSRLDKRLARRRAGERFHKIPESLDNPPLPIKTLSYTAGVAWHGKTPMGIVEFEPLENSLLVLERIYDEANGASIMLYEAAPAGDRLACGLAAGGIVVLDPGSAEVVAAYPLATSARRKGKGSRTAVGGVAALQYSPDGERLAAALGVAPEDVPGRSAAEQAAADVKIMRAARQ